MATLNFNRIPSTDEFLYIPQWNVLFCIKHQHVYRPKNINEHCRRNHKNSISPEISKKLKKILQRNNSSEVFILPEPFNKGGPLPPQPYFKQNTQYACHHCIWKGHSWVSAKRHLKQTHKYQRDTHTPYKPGDDFNVYQVQTACAQDASPVYWRINQATVDEQVTVSVTSSVAPNQNTNQPARSWLGLPNRLLEASCIERRKAIVSNQSGPEISPWDNRTGYLAHANGLTRDEMVAILKIPSVKNTSDRKELILARICNLSNICMEATRRSTAYSELVQWKYRPFNNHTSRLLVSAESGKLSLRPLRYIQAKTAKDYLKHWAEFLCYIYRTRHGFLFTGRSEPLFVPTEGQMEAVDRLSEHLGTPGYDGSLDDPDFFMQSPSRVVRFMQTEQVVTDFFKLSSAFIEEHYRFSFLEGGLLSFSALKNFRPSGSIMTAPEASTFLSRIIYCCQLVVIGYFWSIVSDDELLLQYLQNFQESYMQNHTRTPVGELQSQRAMAMRIGKTEPGLPTTYWLGDSVVVYKNIKLDTNSLEGFVRHLTERAVKVWNQLVFDITVPDLNLRDYSVVPENMGDRSAAYSGLTDARGQVKPIKDQFLQSFFAKLFDNKVDQETNYRNLFTPAWVYSYEQTVEEFLGLVLLLVHICAGQPARGSEILGTRYSNDQTLRNLFVYDGSILISICYHKSQSLTQQQR